MARWERKIQLLRVRAYLPGTPGLNIVQQKTAKNRMKNARQLPGLSRLPTG
jgi:hypothetical protein